ncbi:MAG: type I-E CRISPR-associated protein Cse2/CasB [Kineosporiaceae bacterium]|nr:type I-E CRISPR-associated protein Cse2/CasB [Kineosporiaceae bacterium]
MTDTHERTQGTADELAQFIRSRLKPLQRQYLSPKRNGSVDSRLAQLRHAVTGAPGESAAIWDLTLDGVPRPGRTDVPSATERAAHTVCTLYALHQQAKRTPMFVDGISIGHAMRRLLRSHNAGADPEREGSLRLRFDALLTAESYEELTYHLRGLVQQFRAADVPLDYARLAQDLVSLQRPHRVAGVRIRWGRDYHRLHLPGADQEADGDTTETPDTTDPEELS